VWRVDRVIERSWTRGEAAWNHLPKRATLGRLAAIGALPWVGLTELSLAQPQQKSLRVGLIGYGNSMRLLLDGLRERGYVEGKNLVFERHHAEGQVERKPEIANELLALKLDVIVTTCTPSTRLLHSRTQTIPGGTETRQAADSESLDKLVSAQPLNRLFRDIFRKRFVQVQTPRRTQRDR
jgi:putative ABC transport system substrate-binding protein